ncbi:MAG TPA: MBG domain-containing protein, partial [Planctomycetota bacterium]|nr:MBG domain-containing protein [Planctomycetota bacterium]
MKISRLHSASVFLAVVTLAASVQAATLTWGTPANITADTDVSTTGTAVYAYAWSGVTQAVNGVSFTGTTNTNAGGTDVSLNNFGYNVPTSFSSTSDPFNSLSTAYKNVIMGGDFNIFGDQATVTLQGLIVGRSYQVQVWVSDPRPVNGRTGTITGGNTVTMLYSVNNTAGSPGQYTIGTFTADGTSQSFAMASNGSTQINALQLRVLPPPNAIVWGAATTIAADTDVSTTGTMQYAYNWNGTTQTVNGQTFVGASSSSSSGDANVTLSGSGLGNNGSGTFATTSAPFNNLSTAYKGILGGADDTSSAVPMIVTLNALTVGHTYAVQVWVEDSRAGFQNRNEVLTTTGATGGNVTLNFTNSNANGGLGQYTIGTFTALYTTQALTVTGSVGTSQINALQLRDISPPPTPLTITAMTPAPTSIQSTAIGSILLTFSTNLDPTTTNNSTVKLKSAGPDGILDTADDVSIIPSAISVVNNNQVKVDFTASAKQTEKYRITLNGTTQPVIKSSFNVVLDGEYPGQSGGFPSGNGVAGGDFTTTFEVDLLSTTLACATPNPVNYGATSATLSAVVSSAGQSINSGTISFQLMSGAVNVGSAVTSGSVVNGFASVTYAIPAGTTASGYTIAAAYNNAGTIFAGSTDSSHQLAINTAPLSVTPNNFSRAYASANPTLTGSITGVQNGDNITATYATSAGLTSAVGNYSIVPTLVDPGAKLGNYTVTSNNGTLTVTPVPLSVTAANFSRVYGAANPTFSGTIAGIKNGDNITATYATNATVLSAVANYAIIPTLVDPNNKVGNYTVTSTNGTLTVTQATLTAVAFNATRSYGAANPVFSGILSGVLNGDNILAAYNTAATPASSIGNYAITPSLLDPDGKQSNYSVTLSNGTLNVTKAPLSVAAANVSRAYGAANPTLTGTLTGIQNNDNITATYATSAAPQSLVGTYNIVPTLVDPGSKLSNYSVTSTNGTLTVGTAALTVTPTNASDTYGDAIPVLNGTISGVQNGDNITASYSTSATSGSPIGPYSIVATLADPGNKLPNYAVTLNTGTLTINAAPLSVVADNKSKTYGDPNPTLTGTLSGVVNGDAITASYSTSATSGSAAGTYAIIPALNDPASKLGNYALTSTNGTLTVNKAALSAVASDATRTYGAANPTFSGSLTGVVNGDNIVAAFDSVATPASVVGTYPIAPSLIDPGNKQGNYTVAFTNGTLTVTKAALSVTTADATRFYHAPDPVFTGSLVGIQNNDAISATYSSTALQNSTVGTYTISPSLVDPNGLLGNYTVTSVNGTLTINKATPVIAWPQPSRIFAGVPLDATQLNASASDAFTNTALTGTFTYFPNSSTVLTPGLGQTLSVSFTPDDGTNYNSTSSNNAIDVDPAIPVAITSAQTASGVQNTSFSYTITASGSAPMTFKADGLPAGLTLTGTVISGIPTVTGVFDVVLTVNNYAGSATQPLKLVVTQSTGVNHAPVFSSPPMASANPATTGVPVTLTANATDADGDALDYTWDFGDGTTALSASVSKSYAAAGVYIVNVVVSDGQASASQSINLIVEDQLPIGTFVVQRVGISFNFVKSGSDSLSISGQIPVPPDFNPSGKSARLLIGGLDKSYTLTAKGGSIDKALSLKFKSGASSAAFNFTLKNQALFAPLQPLGFSKTQS